MKLNHTGAYGAKIATLSAAAVLLSTASLAQPQTMKQGAISAQEMYRDMSADERKSIVAEATALASAQTRSATAEERALIAVKPSEARRLIAKGEPMAKSKSTTTIGREFRNGNAVGKVVGTAFLNTQRVTVTADGKHLSTCQSGDHTHDTPTIATLAEAAKQMSKGVGRE
jgi:hypothetical protein